MTHAANCATVNDSSEVEILLLEDSPTDALLVEQTLRETGPFRPVGITTVAKLAEAVIRVQSRRFDAALVDLNVVDSRGIATFVTLHNAAPSLPIVVLSGIEDAEMTLRILRMGAQDCLLKREVFGALLGRSIQFAIERQRIAAELDRRTQELQQSETRIRAIIESSSDAFIIVDDQGIVTFSNAAAAGMLGTDAKSLLGKPIGLPIIMDEPVEVDIRRTDGLQGIAEMHCVGYVWAQAHGNMVAISAATDGNVASMLLLLRDVTDRKRAEEAMRTSEHRLRALIEHSSDGIYVCDADLRFVYASPTMPLLTGYPIEQLSGADSIHYVHAADVSRYKHALAKSISCPQESGTLQWRFLHTDGRYLWLDGTVTNLLDDPAVRGIVVNFRDVTDRVRAEEAQRQSQKMQALGTLAGGIAHDFNNILLAINGNMRLAMADLPPDHPVQRSLAEVGKAGARATDLVRRILTFSRRDRPQREIIDLGEVLDEVLHLLRSTVPATIVLHCTRPSDAVWVYADATQLHQVILNLATNGVHAIGDRDGRIDIELRTVELGEEAVGHIGNLLAGRYVHLAVSDSGCGIEPSELPRIFEPFYTTKPHGQGTGLGLSTVHGIVGAHDGAVTVRSERFKGTTFDLYFPQAAAKSLPSEVPAPPAEVGHGERVLYVDDEEALVFLTKRILERLGYEVRGYADPVEALDEFRENHARYSAVITDLSMAGMSGFQLTKAIRALDADIPIVLTSGYIRPEDHEQAAQLKISELILKPDTVEELGAALHRCLTERNKKTSGWRLETRD